MSGTFDEIPDVPVQERTFDDPPPAPEPPRPLRTPGVRISLSFEGVGEAEFMALLRAYGVDDEEIFGLREDARTFALDTPGKAATVRLQRGNGARYTMIDAEGPR
jgi:hypothetical protein